MRRLFRLSILLLVLFDFAYSALSQHKNVFDNFIKVENIQKILPSINAEIKKCGVDVVLFLVYKNGECKYGRVITDENLDINKTTFPLGKTSVALVSLMAENMQHNGVINTSSDVSKIFSKFRTTKGNIKGATIENLLSQTAGVPYLADKIPPESSVDEFFDSLAQMDFSVSGSSYYPSVASQAIVGYVLAYSNETNSKDLKKSFVRSCRKYLFNPLKIDVVKFRNFDKWSFTTRAFALNLQGIQSWLACETSDNPPIATASAIALRRNNFLSNSACSNGWQKFAKAPFNAVYTADSNNMTVIYKVGQDTLAVSFFIKKDKGDYDFSFANILKNVNLLLTEKF